jgi:hypothetical protein
MQIKPTMFYILEGKEIKPAGVLEWGERACKRVVLRQEVKKEG